MGIGDKLAHRFKDQLHLGKEKDSEAPRSGQTLPGVSDELSNANIYQIRFHYGVNIGAWFVAERWLSSCLFPDDAKGGSEYDAVEANVKKSGEDATRNKWELYWGSWMREEDWNYLVECGANAVRIPFGYFTLGPEFTQGTPFEKYGNVYRNSWSFYKKAIQEARKRNIGVLIDLHALPGGANRSEHSGVSDGDGGCCFRNKHYVELAIRVLQYVTQETKEFDNVLGIQVANEVDYGAKCETFYSDAISAIHHINPQMPVYLSDTWDLDRCLNYVKNKPAVMVDTHVYRCFSDEDKKKTPQQVIDSIKLPHNTHVIVGEYSCVMDGQTWGKVKEQERDKYVEEYGQKQFQTFRENTAGSFFWTLKMDWMDGGEWGFVQMTKEGALPKLNHNNSKCPEVDEQLKKQIVEEHVNYWNSQAHGESMDHKLFEEGFVKGWDDAKRFWAFGGSVIGQLTQFTDVRRASYLQNCGESHSSKYYWEFDHGYARGEAEFRKSVGAY